jgi:hypothetical protein
MNRVGDYTHFAVRFVGLGYVGLWPLSSADDSGRPFGAGLFCGEGGSALADVLCGTPHPLQLSPALHAVGAVAALFVMVRLILRVVRRRRRAPSPAVDEAILVARIPGVIPKLPRQRQPLPPPRPVKPRTHFGLRGAPR